MPKLLKFLDLPSGVILGAYSVTMLLLSVYVTYMKSDIPSGVVTAYGIVVGAFAATKTFKKDKKDEPTSKIPTNCPD